MTTGDVGAPVRALDSPEKKRLASIREQSAAQWQTFLTDGPDDSLGALAWLVGATGPTPADPHEMRDRIDQARDEQFTWRQIADALGEGDSPEAGRRVMDRQKLWSERVG